ncbi:MAG TPA: GNAT family N-acetyltransferase [Nitriliruptoraceae bacterium]|nr:GNAT family N-acetyltransferase [Nitriliruptoraceae bacterium]
MKVRAFRPEDAQAALDLRVAAFSTSMHVEFDDTDIYAPDDHRLVAVDGDRIVGHLAAWPFGQTFGGRVVPMGGVSGVAVAPDQRGRGVGSALLAAGLDLMADRGLVVSTLYPSTPAPYRAWGWEVAGEHVRRTLATRELLELPPPADDVSTRPFELDDLDTVLALHNSITSTEAGGLEASRRWVRRLLTPDAEEPELTFVAIRDEQVVGLLLATKVDGTAATDGFGLRVLHLYGADRDAELALWSIVAANHSVASMTTFNSQPADPLLLALPRTLAEHSPSSHAWMNRLVDAPAAIAARGWPDLTATVDLDIVDPRRPSNDGAWVLEVDAGTGQLTRPAEHTTAPGSDAGRGQAAVGAARLDMGALSSMYTGFAAPRMLARAGRLTGCDDETLDDLTAVFSGPAPFMRDYF